MVYIGHKVCVCVGGGVQSGLLSQLCQTKLKLNPDQISEASLESLTVLLLVKH